MSKSNFLGELDHRGLIQDTTDREDLEKRLADSPLTLYHGIDPSAPSLHIGNFIGVLMLRRFQDAGHKPIALIGGSTGMIGDPGGRSEERNLLDEETLQNNLEGSELSLKSLLTLITQLWSITLTGQRTSTFWISSETLGNTQQ